MRRKTRDELLQRVQFLIRSQDAMALADILLLPDIKGATCSIAVDGLIEMDTADAWDAIGSLMVQSETAVVELIISKLESHLTPGAVRALGEALSNRNVFIRSAAVRALSYSDAQPTYAHLLRATRDPEKSLSRLAGRVLLRRVEARPAILGEIMNVTAEGIFDLMDDRWAMELLAPSFPENVRIMAARRLGVVGGEEASQALARMVQTAQGDLWEECWSALERCHAVSDFILLPLLVDPRAEVKARAVRLYGRFASADAADLMTGMARDESAIVRMASLQALPILDPMAAIPTLETALDDAEEEVRLVAIDLLANLEDSSPELVRAVQQYDGEVRRRALVALANRCVITPELVMLYVEFLYKGSACTDLSQRDYLDSLSMTARTLGKTKNPEVLLALTALARSVIRRLRRAAIEGIMLYDAEDRVDPLYSLIDTHDPDILKNVAMGLHESRDPRAVIPLIRAALECRGRPAVTAKAALQEYEEIRDVDFLIDCLQKQWAAVRRFGAEALKQIQDERSIDPLLEASRDEDVEVQLAVFEAMAPFATGHQKVIDRMLEALASGDISVRQAVCEALGEAKCEAAVPDLIKSLHNFFLRPRATDALKRIGDRKGYLAIKRLERREALFPKKPRDALLEKAKSA